MEFIVACGVTTMRAVRAEGSTGRRKQAAGFTFCCAARGENRCSFLFRCENEGVV